MFILVDLILLFLVVSFGCYAYYFMGRLTDLRERDQAVGPDKVDQAAPTAPPVLLQDESVSRLLNTTSAKLSVAVFMAIFCLVIVGAVVALLVMLPDAQDVSSIVDLEAEKPKEPVVDPTDDKEKEAMDAGTIVGIVFGSLIGLIGLGLLLSYIAPSIKAARQNAISWKKVDALSETKSLHTTEPQPVSTKSGVIGTHYTFIYNENEESNELVVNLVHIPCIEDSKIIGFKLLLCDENGAEINDIKYEQEEVDSKAENAHKRVIKPLKVKLGKLKLVDGMTFQEKFHFETADGQYRFWTRPKDGRVSLKFNN